MPLFNRAVPLVLAALLSACINVPEIEAPESPDAGLPDAGPKPDSGVPADTTSPTITATTPSHGSTNVATSTQLVLTFSEPMNVSTVQVSIAPTVEFSETTWANGNTLLTLQPTVPLAQNTGYTLVVDGKDVAGNALTDRKAFSFSTTGPAPDTTPPTVLAISPAHGTIGVARDASITVTFSEPMDKVSAQAAFNITSPPGFNSGVFDWNEAGTVMTFNPDTDFPHGTDVIWRVSTTAKDPSANTLENNVSGTFRVIRVNTVTINYDPPTTGAAVSPSYDKQTYLFLGALVGDTGNATQARLFLGFKLDALPENLSRLTSAKLIWYTTNQTGDPLASLGSLLLERVYIGEEIALSNATWTNPVAKTQYESPALNTPISVSVGPLIPAVQFNTTSFVASDWLDRTNRGTKRSQFRLRFEVPSDNDAENDSIHTHEDVSTPAELEVTYEYP
ncbi:Ig-like domain-containing protein [Hyalangium gracile]|uniref:Ig-like domain-containing protein n=1 Tax=Hyalangium gracile TaxID=394092 RepID=UPI001CC9FC8F|nr:Ig-like domain-containing protein [Hyalangium gracile]